MRGVRWLVSLLVLGAALVIGGRPASAQCWISATTVSFGHYDGVTTTDAAHSTGN